MKPFWKQRTFWVSLAGVLSAVAAYLDAQHRDLLLSLAGFFGCVGSLTARVGAVEAATSNQEASE